MNLYVYLYAHMIFCTFRKINLPFPMKRHIIVLQKRIQRQFAALLSDGTFLFPKKQNQVVPAV